MRYNSVLILLFFSTNICAQSFEIGHTSITFFDTERDREIETEIFYPAVIAGDEVDIAEGNFPVLVFGHGFLMSWDSYQNFWEELVPSGYVLCFPTTEMSFTPNHAEFGQDMRFIADQMQIENEDEGSLFHNALSDKTGMMGHSMGGGASFLATENNPNVTALVNFASAETTPSAISAAANITSLALLFSGDDDCVAPPLDNQDPLYVNLDSDCKTHIKIINGGHCYFANTSTTCDLGESFCNPNLSISREEQQAVTFNFLNLWLAYTLYDDLEAWEAFNNSLPVSNAINYDQLCNTTGIVDIRSENGFDVFPNPVETFLNLLIEHEIVEGFLTIYNAQGITLHQTKFATKDVKVDVSQLSKGIYFIKLKTGSNTYSKKFIKL